MTILDLSGAPHGGRTRLLPDNATAPRISPRLLILHSIVGSAEGAYRYFRDATNLESTFIVTLGGEVWQLMDTTREADANYRANPFALSVETEDLGDPDVEPWTRQQQDALAWLAHEVHRIHPAIKLQRASAWDGAGIGYHTMWGAPGPWTPVSKTCPGRVRIRQFDEFLLPRIVRGEGGLLNLDAEAQQLIKDQARFVARWIDHGDEEVTGTSNNLAVVRKEVNAKLDQLLARPILTDAQATAIGDQVEAAVREVLADVDTVDEGAIATEVRRQFVTGLSSLLLPPDAQP